MKFTVVIILSLFVTGCSPKPTTETYPADTIGDEQQPDSVLTDPGVYETEDNWDYSHLYGVYLHESNMKGFTAYLEIMPEGNDLSFSLSLKQNSCAGQAAGSVGMAIHGKTEYGGFYNHTDCRMEFIFNLVENTIRIQEVGPCTLHETGCSFNGTYFKKKN